MGFWDTLGKVANEIAKAAVTSGAMEKLSYDLGYRDGLEGRPRNVKLPRDDGSEGWKEQKKNADAYNRGYDDGRGNRG
ncbi:MAG TPA: hypothetical protein VF006_26665 [Longimicrobium sp.]